MESLSRRLVSALLSQAGKRNRVGWGNLQSKQTSCLSLLIHLLLTYSGEIMHLVILSSISVALLHFLSVGQERVMEREAKTEGVRDTLRMQRI